MECCIVPSRFATASSSATWSSLRRRRTVEAGNFVVSRTSSSWKVRVNCHRGSESCVAVQEEFADEEDFIKAGGSQLLFVQMQQSKSMDQQSKLEDKVTLLISTFYFCICYFTDF